MDPKDLVTPTKRKLLVPTSKVDTSPQPVGGSGTVEIRDERGRLVDKEDFTNFVGLAQVEFDKQRVRHGYTNTSLASGVVLSPVNAVAPDPVLVCPTTQMWATDSDLAENAGAERWLPGPNIIATGKRGQVLSAGGTGTPGAIYGGLVPTDSVADLTKLKMVWDFALGQGNGTFRSLCWGPDPYSNPHQHSPWEPAVTTDLRPTTPVNGGRNGVAIDPANGDMYASYPTQNTSGVVGSDIIYKQAAWAPADTSAKLAVTLPSHITAIPTASRVNDLCILGNDIWYGAQATGFAILRISKAAAANPTILQTIAKPWSESEPAVIGTDGTNLYVCRYNATAGSRTIYKIRASDGVTLTSWVHEASCVVMSITWDDASNTLWVVDQVGAGAVLANNNPARYRMVGYTDAGARKFIPHIIHVEGYGQHGKVVFYQGVPYVTGYFSASFYYGPMSRLPKGVLGARSLLSEPKTKASNQTMRITYQFNFA